MFESVSSSLSYTRVLESREHICMEKDSGYVRIEAMIIEQTLISKSTQIYRGSVWEIIQCFPEMFQLLSIDLKQSRYTAEDVVLFLNL